MSKAETTLRRCYKNKRVMVTGHTGFKGRANFQAAMARGASGAFNIASATAVTINELVRLMKEASGLNIEVRHRPPRKGDVRHSLGDISKARRAFGFEPAVALAPGLREFLTWAQREMGG